MITVFQNISKEGDLVIISFKSKNKIPIVYNSEVVFLDEDEIVMLCVDKKKLKYLRPKEKNTNIRVR